MACRVLVATDRDGVPRGALAHARTLAGPKGEVVLAAVLVVPVSQPLDASLDVAVARACTILEDGERLAGDIDTRLVRARTFAKGVLELLEAERFDSLVLERGPAPLRNGAAGQLDLLMERAPVDVVVVRPAPR